MTLLRTLVSDLLGVGKITLLKRTQSGGARRFGRNNSGAEHLESRCLLSATYGGIDDLLVDTTAYSDSQVVVKFDGTPSAQNLPLLGLKLGDSLGSDGLYEVYLDSKVSPEQAITALEAHPSVEYAHPDFEVQLALTPNDSHFSSLWGMHNTGQSGGLPDADIDAPEAWNTRTDASGVVVAVIDTGIDYTHPDLADNMWTNFGEIAGDGIDNDNNGFVDDVFGYDFVNNDGDPMDDNDHGTHVAGTVGAQGNNNKGVVGVAWDVQLMALKFLDAGGSGSTSDAIAAINYATQMGADIANNSWGGGGFSSSLQNAINNFVNNGGIFTAAAGNHGGNNDISAYYPANYNNVVSVAASTHIDGKASFSGYGTSTVDIAAPGESIRSTIPGNKYAYFDGTSMATPMVSGAFALLRAEFPGDSNSQLVGRMMQNADPALTQYTTHGRLNLAAALAGGSNDASGPKIDYSMWSGSVNSVSVTFNEQISAASFTTADVSLSGPNGPISVSSVTPISGSNNTQFSIGFAGQSAQGNYTMSIGPNITDVVGNSMDQDMDGTSGESSDDVFVTSHAIGNTTTYQWNGNTSLKDAKANRKGIVRPGKVRRKVKVKQKITVGDINVQITLNHTWDNDLMVVLVSPRRSEATLIARRGGSGDNIYATFDDEAATSIANGSAPFSGTYRPETPLSVFDGELAKGNWSVFVYDLATGDSGNITNVTLVVSADEQQDAAEVSVRPTPGVQPTNRLALQQVQTDLFPEPPTDSDAPYVINSRRETHEHQAEEVKASPAPAQTDRGVDLIPEAIAFADQAFAIKLGLELGEL